MSEESAATDEAERTAAMALRGIEFGLATMTVVRALIRALHQQGLLTSDQIAGVFELAAKEIESADAGADAARMVRDAGAGLLDVPPVGEN